MFDMDRDVQRVVRAYAKSEMVRPWLSEITSRASSTLEHRVISSTSTVAVSNQNVRVQAAAKGRRLSGGLDPKTDYPAVEFGANRGKRKTYTRKGHRVTRRTAVQLKPRRKSGYVFWPAAEEMIPRLAALWVQSIVKGIANVFDGKAF
jgi:CRISPR/Cas system endoribonuclease Cas6 (RAMP superfamily)